MGIYTALAKLINRYSFSEISKQLIVPLVFLTKEQSIEVLQYFYYY